MDTPLWEREFLRVSVDNSGEEISLEQQHNANVADAISIGHKPPDLEDAYREVGSVSEFAKKPREDFPRLMRDIASGAFGAPVLHLWETSRGARTMSDSVALYDALKAARIMLRVTTHERTYKPWLDVDRKHLLQDAIENEQETAKSSKRLVRDLGDRAKKGRPHGRIPYGYRAIYSTENGDLLRREPRPDEAAVVLEMYQRIAKGHALGKIVADLTRRGILTRSGTPWRVTSMTKLCRRRLYIGEREFHPGRRGHRGLSANPLITEGVWEPIVSRDLWLMVNAILRDPGRRTSREGGLKWCYSGIPGCHVCGEGMTVSLARKHPMYRSTLRGCTMVRKDELDEILTEVLIAYLSREDIFNRFQADRGQELMQVRARLLEVNNQLSDLQDAVGRMEVSVAMAARAEPPLLDEIQRLEALQLELSTPDVLRALIMPGADVRQRWAEAEVATQHKIAKLLFVPEHIGRPIITRKPVHVRKVSAIERLLWQRPEGLVMA